ncbi:lipase family protein [Nocardia sp. NEAU-G5]|uniref:Lipase family protein n=1 Tax=Nocardia albiluteola TaxID=2842303 RepID=A0ABS6BCW2_9NOCA|nr:lipase family protein [Nocardia albiluteola]MBU3068133.1 lipase family protein [Nocardia albiluteola]
MRLTGGWGRTILAGALALAAAATPVIAEAAPTTGTPGSVIGVDPKPAGFHGLSGGSVIDYWMTGSDGAPRRASGALFVPPGRAPAGGWPIMAYDHGTSGLGSGCGGMSAPGPMAGENSAQDQLLQYFVSKGFAVVAPDYLGLGRFDTGPHPYLERRTEATSTIDLVRAARAANSALSRTWVVTGTSQGGQAALGAGHLQRTYAPDLDFRGTITIDPESDLEAVLPAGGPWVSEVPGVGGDATTAFIAMTLVGLRETHPEANVDSYLSPRGREVLDSAGALCLPGIVKQVRGASIGDLLSRQLTTPSFQAALDSYMAVPTSGYNAPILLLTNVTDNVIPPPFHAALAAQFVANGVDFRAVVGKGKHCELNPQMYAAMDAFVARVHATPTRP